MAPLGIVRVGAAAEEKELATIPPDVLSQGCLPHAITATIMGSRLSPKSMNQNLTRLAGICRTWDKEWVRYGEASAKAVQNRLHCPVSPILGRSGVGVRQRQAQVQGRISPRQLLRTQQTVGSVRGVRPAYPTNLTQ